MKTSVIAALILATTAILHAEAPSDASLKELLELSGSKKLVIDMQARMKSTMNLSMDRALAGQTLPPEKKEALEKTKAKTLAIISEEMNWDQMESLYLQVYRESFNQQEINDLITFYKSPTGQMFVEKMPVIMNKSMALMQQRMGPMMERIRSAQKESMSELNPAKDSTPPAKASPTPTTTPASKPKP
jgi:hypothetical protein